MTKIKKLADANPDQEINLSNKQKEKVSHLDRPHTGCLWRIVGWIEGGGEEALVSTETPSTAWTRGQRVREQPEDGRA